MSNRTFWKIVKPFLANQPCMTSDGFSIDKDEDAITDEKVLVEFFNENYRIIVEISPVKIVHRTMLLLKKLYQNTLLIPVSKKLKCQGFELA